MAADEVRALAERTTRATHEIGEMIKAIRQETGGAVAPRELGVKEVEKVMDSSRRSGGSYATQRAVPIKGLPVVLWPVP